MEKTNLRYLKLALTVFVGMTVGYVHTVQAGYTGVINGAGVGWASVNVRSVTDNTNRVTSPGVTNPSVTMSRYPGYTYTTNNPAGASGSTYSRLKGLVGGVWQATTFAAAGDGTDNRELETRLIIKPANCASLTMDTEIDLAAFNANGHSSTIKVTTTGTPGTALWLRGFEYTGDQSLLPPDDPDTVPNETIEYLKIHGTWKFETLIEGPFDFNPTNGGCPLLIPFTLATTNLENLIFAADGVAKTFPFTVTCPSDVTFNCGEAVKFPAAEVNGGCGQITGTWSPEEDYKFPVGSTPVTVTVTDDGTNTATCTFNVTITDNEAPATPTLLDVTVGQCSGTPPTPTTTDNCSGTVTGTTTTPFPITTQGTTVVTWTFDDGNGHVTTANQNVIVDDVTPPVAPPLAALSYATCSGTNATPPTPTATDNCKGPVIGTTTTPFPITNLGTTVVTWTFNDGNGNVTTANQNVTLTGLTFTGFYNPINGTNGSCNAPLVTKAPSSTLPIKFDITCGTAPITGGTPPVVRIQAYGADCAPGAEVVVTNAVYQNNWHYNWNVSGRIGGTYKITVDLPDATSRFVFVKLK